MDGHTKLFEVPLGLSAPRWWNLRSSEAPADIELVEETAMYGHLVRIANWVRMTPEGVFDATPPHDVARDMLVNPDEDLPPLDAVVKTPVFDAAGKLVSTPGYHRDGGIL